MNVKDVYHFERHIIQAVNRLNYWFTIARIICQNIVQYCTSDRSGKDIIIIGIHVACS